MAMRYRRLSYRYAVVMQTGPAWPLPGIWGSDRPRLLGRVHWQPDMDTYETPTTVEVIVDLAGIDEDEVEMQLFEDALVVQGRRELPACQAGAIYQAAGIRQGPFQLEIPLPSPVNPDAVEARYERGLLWITLPKRAKAR